MKKQTTHPVQAHLIRGAFYLALVLTVCAIPFAVAQRTATKQSLAKLGNGFPITVSHRTLTFTERVAYQRAIEDVYWRHRIWPTERPDPKPPLDAVMSQAQIERKVAGYLRDSLMLEDYWQQPIGADQLQEEMDRMAQHTKQPKVLSELFAALGNDPFVVAECLARPAITEQSLANFAAQDQRLYSELIRGGGSGRTRTGNWVPTLMAAANADYRLPTIPDGLNGCIDNWARTSTTSAPSARAGHTAVWTGSEMIVWGGNDGSNFVNTGGRYYPSTNSWAPSSTTSAPSARAGHTAVWTGSEMIVWGGSDTNAVNTGGRYDPNTDNWAPTNTSNAPSAREHHTAVWTGTEMIVWGGQQGFSVFDTGGRYDPNTDAWSATSTANAPSARVYHTAVWTGSEMIIWGGGHVTFIGSFDTGGRYDPSTNSWTATNTTNPPHARGFHTAVWTGSEMIVWGGAFPPNPPGIPIVLDTGGRYDPSSDSWAPTSTTNAPSGRWRHTGVWTDSEMIVWGGDGIGGLFDTGGRYDPNTDAWSATSTANAPDGREYYTTVWSGSEMIVWGGIDSFGPPPSLINTGGRYCAPIPRVTPRPRPTAHQRPSP